MSANAYFEAAIDSLRKAQQSQADSISAAADLMVGAITSDARIFAFGASHSFILAEEMVYRTGGLMLVNPIYPHGMNLSVRPMTMTSQIERVPGLGATLLTESPARKGDVLIIASTSGRNAVVIDMAIAAKDMRIKTIAITSLAYSSGVSSRHPSGKKLCDLCDVVIDNCAPYGDAAVEIAGFAQRVGPLSSVTGCAIVNALAAELVAKLVEHGVEPPVFMSANLDAGDKYNARLLEANKDRIFYLD